MPKSYAQLREKIQALQGKADNARAAAASYVIRQIKQAVSFYKLTAEDLGLLASADRSHPAPKRATERSESLVGRKRSRIDKGPARFRNADGQEWVGRGPRPQWLRAALSKGSTLSDFEVGRGKDQSSGTAVATKAHTAKSPGSRTVKGVAKKRRSARQQPMAAVSRPVAKVAKKQKVSRTPKTVASSAGLSVKPAAQPKGRAARTPEASQPLQKREEGTRSGAKKSAPPGTKPTLKKTSRRTSAKAKSKKSIKPTTQLTRRAEDSERQPELLGDAPKVDANTPASPAPSSSGNEVPSAPVAQPSRPRQRGSKKTKPAGRAASVKRDATAVELEQSAPASTPAV